MHCRLRAGQSQIGAIIEAGLVRAFSLDWKGATEDTKDATVDDYLDVIDLAVDHCGGRANLIGDCQGGWLATIYAALHPERVNTLTLAGAPIDFHAGEPIIHEVIAAGRAWRRPALLRDACRDGRRRARRASTCSRAS